MKGWSISFLLRRKRGIHIPRCWSASGINFQQGRGSKSYNPNAECKIRSKPTLGLPFIVAACLRLAVTCRHVLTVTSILLRCSGKDIYPITEAVSDRKRQRANSRRRRVWDYNTGKARFSLSWTHLSRTDSLTLVTLRLRRRVVISRT
jgi:hypothetical protein